MTSGPLNPYTNPPSDYWRPWKAAAASVQLVGDVLSGPGPMPQNSVVDALSGVGGVVTQKSGVTIKLTQGGTLVVPLDEVPLRWQPRDPAKAPFEFFLSHFTSGGVVDSILEYGYNSSGSVPGEPACFFGIEQDWFTGGVHTFEMYWQANTAGGGTATRPLFVSINRGTMQSTLIASLGAVSGGSFQVQDSAGNIYTVQTDSLIVYTKNNYPLYFNDTTATSRQAIVLDATNTFNFGDPAIKSMQRGSQFETFRSVAAAYTIDTTGLDVQVQQTTANPVTLPDPAASAGRVLEVWTTVAAGATLARHGAEKINGVAGSLALTQYKVYSIRCNGTDWFTN